MLWLAPAGLRGGLKLEAYHQSRQPQSFFLCGPRCSGTSDRCSVRLGVISHALLRQPYLRLHRCGDLGFVSRHMPAEHRIPDVLAAPDVVASCITSCRGRRVSFSTRRCGVTVCLQSRRRLWVYLAFFRKMFTHLFARSGRPAWEDRPSFLHLQSPLFLRVSSCKTSNQRRLLVRTFWRARSRGSLTS